MLITNAYALQLSDVLTIPDKLTLIQWQKPEPLPAGPDYCEEYCSDDLTKANGEVNWADSKGSCNSKGISGSDCECKDDDTTKRDFVPRGLSSKRWATDKDNKKDSHPAAGANANAAAGASAGSPIKVRFPSPPVNYLSSPNIPCRGVVREDQLQIQRVLLSLNKNPWISSNSRLPARTTPQ